MVPWIFEAVMCASSVALNLRPEALDTNMSNDKKKHRGCLGFFWGGIVIFLL